jgi:hypothetical protein
MHNFFAPWVVLFHDAFDKEFSNLKEGLQDEHLAQNSADFTNA